MLAWVSKTPLGGPVDPEVYMMQNKSSGVGPGPICSRDNSFSSPRAMTSDSAKIRPFLVSKILPISPTLSWDQPHAH